MDFGLKGKSAVVCGASAGLGRAVAEALAAEGAQCFLVARREDLLAAVSDDLRQRFGVNARFCAADLSTQEGVSRVLDRVHGEFGETDVLVTNAGGPPAGGFEDSVSEENLRLGWELTFLSAVRMIRGLLPGMKRKRWGRIVAITSLSVHEPVPGLALSNAYRPGLTGLLKTLSAEVAAEGITVNSVCPGYTRTDRLQELARAASLKDGTPWESHLEGWARSTPAGRIGEPSELAAAVAFLCSEQAGYITGVALPVDGGRVHHLLA
jgi:3-oxoacyl-[acyl-carrier protein] reductase